MADLQWRRACLPAAASTTCMLRVALTVLSSIPGKKLRNIRLGPGDIVAAA